MTRTLRVSFPSLVEVKGELSVASDEDLAEAKTYERGADFPGIDVDFPVLEKAALLYLVGNISRFVRPKLQSVISRRPVNHFTASICLL